MQSVHAVKDRLFIQKTAINRNIYNLTIIRIQLNTNYTQMEKEAEYMDNIKDEQMKKYYLN